ncbi:MAG: hypothetical protein R3281_02225 [Balneolaceae bacterium]|nr:hypothetical protein [Balneolaceae bacterium]
MSALEQFLDTIPDWQHPSVKKLHSTISLLEPQLSSSIKWGNLTYHTSGNVCALVSHKNHINLQIWNALSW